ncbi:MAG: 30S ribosomal protein S6 [Spirochaetia bacterium]|nr:30S ribosomal protein S6 [Spirochaetia bacterium]
MRKYEVTFIFRPENDKFEQGKTFVKDALAKTGVNFLEEKDLGEKILAYEIKKQTKGHYYYFLIEMDPAVLNPISKEIRLNAEILKFLFVKLDK